MFNMIPYRTRSIVRNPMMVNPFSDEFFRPFFEGESLGFRVDVKDEGDHYLMEAELPGVDKDNVHVNVVGGVMTVTAAADETHEEKKDNYVCRERRTGSMRRSFNLEGIDEENISAEYVNGVLRVNLPKAAPEPEATKREIKIA